MSWFRVLLVFAFFLAIVTGVLVARGNEFFVMSGFMAVLSAFAALDEL